MDNTPPKMLATEYIPERHVPERFLFTDKEIRDPNLRLKVNNRIKIACDEMWDNGYTAAVCCD